MTLCGWQNIKIQLLSNLCCLVAVVFVCFPSHWFSQTRQHESHLPPCWNYSCLNLSIVFSFSRVFCLCCVFSPNPCNIITLNSHSSHWPFLIQLHANTFTAHPFSLAAPPFLSLSHTHKFRPPPTPPNKSLLLPAPPDHSLPLTLNDCEITKTLGKHQSPHHSHGGLKTAKMLTGRKLWTRLRGWQSSGRKKTAMCLNCRLTAMRILLDWTAAKNTSQQVTIFTAVRIKKTPTTIRRAAVPIRIHGPLFAQPRCQ